MEGLWNRSVIRILSVGLLALGLLLGVRAYLGSQPWPATTERLSDDARFHIDDREFTNEATASKPIELRAGQRVELTGELSAWDYPFLQVTRGRPIGEQPPARSLDFILVFRRIEIFTSQGATKYDGLSTREVADDGNTMRVTHTTTAPRAEGVYRAQLLAFERNQALLARASPKDLGKPLGTVAEALVRVVTSNKAVGVK